tara:strand:+ start:14467 stop:16725 length:2259 start_codon:yes stop_codon:yes gene_type:complete
MATQPKRRHSFSTSDWDTSAQKGANDTINWGDVASGFSTKLRDISTDRKKRKQDIQDAYGAQMEKLSDVQTSDDPTVQAQLVAVSQQSMRELSDRYDMVKSGLLSPEDFSLFRTEQKADYKTTAAMMQNMGKWAQDVQTKINNQTATTTEIEVYERLTKFGGLSGVQITTGLNGRLEYATLKNKRTISEAKDILAKQQNKKTYEISYEDAASYVINSPSYGNEFSNARGDNIGVQELSQLFTYRGDPNVEVNVSNAIAEQVKLLGTYVNTFFDTTTGVTTTIDDFRKAPGTDDKEEGGAYRETLKILQDRLATGDSEIVQTLTTIGGYRIAESAEDAKKRYGDNVDLNRIIYLDVQNGVVSYTNMSGLKYDANKAIEKTLNSQIDSSVKSSTPNVAFLNRQDQITATKKNIKIVSGIGQDIKNIMSGDKETGLGTAKDRIADMNDRLAADGMKINFIKRNKDNIIISRTKTDDYGQQTDMTITIKNNGDISQKEIGREIYRAIVPKSILKDYAYKGFYDLLKKEEEFSFTPRTITDPTDSTKTIDNPNYYGSEEFETENTFTKINPYNMAVDGLNDDNTFSLFETIPGGRNNFQKAAPVVDQAYQRALNRYGIPVVVTTKNVAGDTNEIIVTYQDPETNQETTKTFEFDEDNVQLRSEVNKHINSLIDKLNVRIASGLPAPSDKRLKENIKLVGQSPNGVNIYNWNYKIPEQYGEGKFSGVIAQEVPWATISVNDYLFVDYSKVDVDFKKIS